MKETGWSCRALISDRIRTREEMIHLRSMSLTELEGFIAGLGEPPYRGRQIAFWIYNKLAMEFEQMTDLPRSLREALNSLTTITSMRLVSTLLSKDDGTRKFLFELSDGEFVEAVLMRHNSRITLCVSTQVGCPLDCIFCRTGQGGFRRNLGSGEILDQICWLKSECGGDTEKVNIVLMGMGEPLLNYDQVVRAIRIIVDPNGMSTAGKRITVSTAGIPDKIRALADEGLNCLLAVSLNAPSDTGRKALMPALSRYKIDEILEASVYYHKKTRRRVTLEYVLIHGVNTSDGDALSLGKLIHKGPYKLNLIPYNPGTGLESVCEEEIDRFIKILLPYAPAVTVRRSRGSDIQAACGQLWTENIEKKIPAKDFHD
jgi:23S rRNA (adenine2503-C2)-methyltransferase